MTTEKILKLARGELGVKESPARSNRVKYNTAYYGREVSGSNLHWCAVFIWWLFRQAGAPELYFGGEKTAYCPALLHYHRAQKVADGYQPGDIIFFNFQGGFNAQHVGVCESFDGTYITTIDGNTGDFNEANGGAVMRRTRHKKYIVGAYRPKYEEEETVTQEQFDAMMERWLVNQSTKVASDWARDFIEKAVSLGITDGSRPQSFATREEVDVMILSALKLGGLK